MRFELNLKSYMKFAIHFAKNGAQVSRNSKTRKCCKHNDDADFEKCYNTKMSISLQRSVLVEPTMGLFSIPFNEIIESTQFNSLIQSSPDGGRAPRGDAKGQLQQSAPRRERRSHIHSGASNCGCFSRGASGKSNEHVDLATRIPWRAGSSLRFS